MYSPTKGFFDISKRPKGLDKRTHQNMQNIQMNLAHMQTNAKQYKEQLPLQWEKAKEASAQLQQMIFEYYPHEELFGPVRHLDSSPEA